MSYIEIGKIIKPHGLKGSMKIVSFSDFSEDRFQVGNTIYIKDHDTMVPLTVEQFSLSPKATYLKVEEWNHIDEINTHRHQILFMDKEEQHSLEEDQYYRQELYDCKVLLDGKVYGVVSDIVDVPQGQLLRVTLPTNKTTLVPFRKEFVKKVNLDTKEIELIEWEGLL